MIFVRMIWNFVRFVLTYAMCMVSMISAALIPGTTKPASSLVMSVVALVAAILAAALALPSFRKNFRPLAFGAILLSDVLALGAAYAHQEWAFGVLMVGLYLYIDYNPNRNPQWSFLPQRHLHKR